MSHDKGLLMFAADIDTESEDDFNRWYEEEHIPTLGGKGLTEDYALSVISQWSRC